MIRILLSIRLAEKRWSQADLARKTGIRAATINEFYNELSDRIKLAHLEAMCNALGCDVGDLMTVVPDDPAESTEDGQEPAIG